MVLMLSLLSASVMATIETNVADDMAERGKEVGRVIGAEGEG